MDGDPTTQQLSERGTRDDAKRFVALTIIAHPDVRRIGERVRLHGPAKVSRLEPAFASPHGGDGRALDDAFVSRTPLAIRPEHAGAALQAAATLGVIVDGEPLSGTRTVPNAALDEGVTVELGPRVAVLLHRLPAPSARPPALGLTGESEAIDQLRTAIVRAAKLAVPVLLRGETGSGKELAAMALHEQSNRDGALISVNLAAIPPSAASAALFGRAELRGHFRDADRGSVFLDEIGEIPLDVQAALLRVIETGEVQPVGGQSMKIDLRVISATDRDLDAAVAAGTFRAALLHRLAAIQIAVPPLRARRDDIARLFVGFVREELARLDRASLLDDATRRRPWLGASVLAALTRHAWPGNVRQLRNVARQIALAAHDADEVTLEAFPELGLGGSSAPAETAPTSEQIIALLERHRYRIAAAAAELGVSRARMYVLAEKLGGLRTARDVGRAEITAVLASCGSDLDAAAASLRISPRALTLRMTELGIER